MHKEISSTQNPTVKKLVHLQEKSRERRKQGLFTIEGSREILLACQANYTITHLFYNNSIADTEVKEQILSAIYPQTSISQVTQEVYDKIAYRNTTEGFIALAKTKNNKLEDLRLPENPLILVAEAPEKPGNIGALLRTADAAGVDAFILANPKTDLYNPNIVRSSVGCLFTNQVATGSSQEIINFLQQNKIKIYSAILQDAIPYNQLDFKGSSAIVVGTEAVGLSPEWRTNSAQNIIIPMQGMIDSMNVSVAAGILIFEARRQRGFKNP